MSEQALNEFERTKEKLIDDFKAIIVDAEELLRASANASGEGFNLARAKFAEKLKATKARLTDVESRITDGAKQAASATDDYVKTNPWTAAGIGAGIGLIVGVLVARR
ncbi:MAG: DUF883 family protein [Sulfuricaulis sp.]